ncbi:MAG: TIGR01906 family membrane protein [Clostridium celatum]|nr:TIGR01906 family membrane protein [Clostridium celatum]
MDTKSDKILYLNIFTRILMSIFTAVAIIAIATIIALNLRFIYIFIIDKYKLVNITGVSKANLIIDYNELINYLQNPFIESLKFENFTMSSYGEIHFLEVKRIFISLIVIALVFIIANLFYIFLCKLKMRSSYKNIIKNLNSGSNILIIFFIILLATYVIDFSKAFIIFHKIFFKNDYWIFDATIDPIINALPEDLFMIYGAIILGIVILSSIIIKLINKKMPR